MKLPSRRDFLKLLGIGAAAVPVAASVEPAKAESAPTGPSEPSPKGWTHQELIEFRTEHSPPRTLLEDLDRAETEVFPFVARARPPIGVISKVNDDGTAWVRFGPSDGGAGGSVELVDVGGHHIELRRFPNGTVMVAEADEAEPLPMSQWTTRVGYEPDPEAIARARAFFDAASCDPWKAADAYSAATGLHPAKARAEMYQFQAEWRRRPGRS